MQEKERLILFTGHFGSGKTEFSINYSIRSAREGLKTILVDLDIVNPFFRSTEVKDYLISEGVKVLSPTFAGTTSDVPALPAEIYSVFADKDARVIFDVGGDEMGARALGSFFPFFSKEDYRMFYVINAKRPLSSSREDIIEMLLAVEEKSRLKVTDLVNNTNLSYETKVCDIIEGQGLIAPISEELKIPITYIGGTKDMQSDLPPKMDALFYPIEIYMKPPWR